MVDWSLEILSITKVSCRCVVLFVVVVVVGVVLVLLVVYKQSLTLVIQVPCHSQAQISMNPVNLLVISWMMEHSTSMSTHVSTNSIYRGRSCLGTKRYATSRGCGALVAFYCDFITEGTPILKVYKMALLIEAEAHMSRKLKSRPLWLHIVYKCSGNPMLFDFKKILGMSIMQLPFQLSLLME